MKKNKRVIRIISILLLAFMFLGLINSAYAIEVNPDQVITGKGQETAGSTELAEKGGKLLGIVSTVGIILSVVALMVIGIKFMLGSVEEKAQYKEHFKPYLIGVAMVFCISTILRVIASLIK